MNAVAPRLDQILVAELATWPTRCAGVVVVDAEGSRGSAGDLTTPFPWASVTKLLTSLTLLDAVEQGIVELEEPAGPPGATLRHLLAHVSGLAFDEDRLLAQPGERRVYSNRGIELAAAHLEARRGRPFADLLREAVLEPLGMSGSRLGGSPAHGATGPVADLALLAQELVRPRVLSAKLVASATTTAFGGLDGLLPGFGRQRPNDWGLGFEVRGRKSPHWTSAQNSSATFGHFGQSGAFLWVDPEFGVACVAAGDTPFGPWAAEAWPRLGDRVLAELVPEASSDEAPIGQLHESRPTPTTTPGAPR